MSSEERCRHCGGKLEWVALPHVVWPEGKKPEGTLDEVGVFMICSKCGRVKDSEATRRLPSLSDLQRETDERRREGK
jgi:hypothetical protein